MKKVFVFVLMAITFFTISTWGQNTAPLIESFENGVPNDWTVVGVTGSDPIELSSDFSRTGNYSMYFAYDCDNGGVEGYLITSKLFPTETNHTLSMYCQNIPNILMGIHLQ